MTDYKRSGKAAVDGLRNLFRAPQVPLVTGMPGRKPVRYDRNAQDAAVYFGQFAAMDRLRQCRVLNGAEIQPYVDAVLAMPWPRWRQGEQWAVVVNVVSNSPTAHYRSGVITVPERIPELIVLHEVAHHFAPPVGGHHGSADPQFHGPAWVAAYLDLIEHVVNAAAAGVFRECLEAEGISV